MVSVIWQDKAKEDILLSRFGKDLKSETNIKLTNPLAAQLIAATKDNSGNYYYLTVNEKHSKKESDIVTLYKIDTNEMNSSLGIINIYRNIGNSDSQ